MTDFILLELTMVKRFIRHPATSRIWGISLGAVLAFAMVLWWYKSSFDTIKDDVKTMKTDVSILSKDMAVVKDRLSIK